MLTKIDLCSMALLKLGEAPIQSLTDNSAASQLARTLYDPVIDALLASHSWRFATRTYDLARTADGDFLLPADVLRVLRCDGRIVGNRIQAPGPRLSIQALVRTPSESFPGYFASLAATKLAMEFCIPLVGEQSVFRMLTALYETELQSAKFIDSSAAKSGVIDDFSLLSVRY